MTRFPQRPARRTRGYGLALLFLTSVSSCPLHAQEVVLPEGPGKSTLEKVCGDCHGTEVYADKHLNKEKWNETIDRMIDHGARASDAQFDQIVAYLVKNFGPAATAPAAAKIDVNKATADELAAGLEISTTQSQAIISYRQMNGDFKTVQDLLKVPGLDAAKVEANKDRLTF